MAPPAARADALLLGRATYELMASAWRRPATGSWPDWMDEWEIPLAETIARTKKYVVSSTRRNDGSPFPEEVEAAALAVEAPPEAAGRIRPLSQ